jgi:hypothetical protein
MKKPPKKLLHTFLLVVIISILTVATLTIFASPANEGYYEPDTHLGIPRNVDDPDFLPTLNRAFNDFMANGGYLLPRVVDSDFLPAIDRFFDDFMAEDSPLFNFYSIYLNPIMVDWAAQQGKHHTDFPIHFYHMPSHPCTRPYYCHYATWHIGFGSESCGSFHPHPLSCFPLLPPPTRNYIVPCGHLNGCLYAYLEERIYELKQRRFGVID